MFSYKKEEKKKEKRIFSLFFFPLPFTAATTTTIGIAKTATIKS